MPPFRIVLHAIGRILAKELVAQDARNKYGHLLDKGVLYKLLNNRTYIGDAVHKGTAYPGEHEAIIDRKLWDQVHAILQTNPRKRAAKARAQTPALLKGIIFGPSGEAMSPSHTRKAGKLYRYYFSQHVLKGRSDSTPVSRVPAVGIEKIVIDQMRALLQAPEVIVQVWRQARKSIKGISETEVRESLVEFDALWNELYPAEQARIVNLLVQRVDVLKDGIDVHLRIDGLTSLHCEIRKGSDEDVAA